MFQRILAAFTGAIEAGDAGGVAALFAPNGEYHDGVYGVFRGPADIERLFRDHWFKETENYRWEMLEPVFGGRVGYTNWLFSYNLKAPERNSRMVMEGASQFVLRSDGLIERYREWVEGAGALLRAGAPQDRVLSLVFQHDDAVRARPDAAPHFQI
ncbi:MAG: nuclear transport factor 2 family protein [Alphaproteobacteria bacterium]|nr:nuclear transport factor 2 family protein [Alphaproteobacteria bacterium]MBU1515635.1 nuclear transport factor 2 family protein [Alphaproteobacteria bacterium]MBU2094894.1 nuclear transport factor 2 family protein [Alphaproteobacteria bacterium]MBU2150926.1 nuclear transport factor 2 family protein [Alphaproteobacteria bacterium]MBU2305903.1 nuclear transport factor 2 family protein [Alphaproteobacteria bacterium]